MGKLGQDLPSNFSSVSDAEVDYRRSQEASYAKDRAEIAAQFATGRLMPSSINSRVLTFKPGDVIFLVDKQYVQRRLYFVGADPGGEAAVPQEAVVRPP